MMKSDYEILKLSKPILLTERYDEIKVSLKNVSD